MKILGVVEAVENIAEGQGIRELSMLRQRYGDGNWKKKKGLAMVQLADGSVGQAEVH